MTIRNYAIFYQYYSVYFTIGSWEMINQYKYVGVVLNKYLDILMTIEESGNRALEAVINKY